MNVKDRRPRKYYDEECCTFLSDLDDDAISEERRENEFTQNRTNFVLNTRRKNITSDESTQDIIHEAHELQSIIINAPLHLQKNDSPFVSIYVNNSTDEEVDLSTEEIMSQTKTQNSPTVRRE